MRSGIAIFASGISIVYGMLTALWAFMLWFVGMPIFDSVAHDGLGHYPNHGT